MANNPTSAPGGQPGGQGRAPAADQPGAIRNVVLVGHTGAGKTTLAEALLVATGTISRAGRVEDGTTVSDFDEAEQRQQRSISLALAPCTWDGVKINLLDAPGYADFVGDLRAGLRAADAALFVVSAVDGVDGSTRLLWEECAAVGMPRAVVVTKLDHARADFDETVAVCQRVFGEGVLPLYLPMAADDGTAAGLIGLLSQRVFDYSSGTRTVRDPDPEHLPLIESARNALIEGIIAESEDESLMDRYLEGEEIEVATLVEDLEKAVARGSFYPVLAAAAPRPGSAWPSCSRSSPPASRRRSSTPSRRPPTRPASRAARSPATRPARCWPRWSRRPPTRTSGRISLVRVFSGTLRPDTVVHVSGHFGSFFGESRGHEDHDVDERIGALSSPLGKTQRTVGEAAAGDIVAIAKLTRAETGDTLSAKEDPLLMEPWVMPDPLLPVAITAHAKADDDKLAQGLQRLVAEDPTLRLENNPETHQLVLWTMGEAHVDVLLDRLRNRYGVAVDSVPLRVSLRETFAAPSKGHGRHVKQSGGHGQFAVCDIEVEPLPHGSGLRVRRQGRRRRGAPSVHPVGGEGRARADGPRAWRPGTR